MFHIFILSGVRLYREGLAEHLDRRYGLSVVCTCCHSVGAISAGQDLAPDIVLIDMATTDSHDTARDLIQIAPTARIVALGVVEAENEVLHCAEVGIAAYVPREGGFDDLVATVEAAARGELVC